MKTSKWGWVGRDGEAQLRVFDTPNEAIEDMKARLGDDFDIERCYQYGFKLALVSVEVKALMVLEGTPEWQ